MPSRTKVHEVPANNEDNTLPSEPTNRKGRGCSRKAGNMTADVAAVQDVPTANAEKRKHSQTTMAMDIDDGAQPTKKSKPGTKKTPAASKSGQKRV
jgi:hypothetical protein